MPAYLVATIGAHVTDTYDAHRGKVTTLIEKHGGRFIVRGGERTTLEGTWPDGRTMVIEFPDFAAAKAFVADPDYAPVSAIRRAAADAHAFIVDGAADARSGQDYASYLLASIVVEDPETYKGYAAHAPAVVEQYKGTFLARGGRAEGVEGAADPDRIVLIGFADRDGARRFHGSAEYAPLIEIRHSASTGSSVALAPYRP